MDIVAVDVGLDYRAAGTSRAGGSSLRKTEPANVASAAIASRWLRRLYHEMVPVKVQAS
jgi:hypothetical protein